MSDWKETKSGGCWLQHRGLRAVIQFNPHSETFGIVLRLRTRFDDAEAAIKVAEQMIDALDDADLVEVAG